MEWLFGGVAFFSWYSNPRVVTRGLTVADGVGWRRFLRVMFGQVLVWLVLTLFGFGDGLTGQGANFREWWYHGFDD